MATFKDLQRVKSEAKRSETISEFSLLSIDDFDDVKFANLMSEKFNHTFVDIKSYVITDDLLAKLPKKFVEKFKLLPIKETDSSIVLASFDPYSEKLVKQCSDILGKECEFVLTNLEGWASIYRRVRMTVDELVDLIEEYSDDNNVQDIDNESQITHDTVEYVNRILADAFVRKASDIHVEPYEKIFRIRFRIDGNLFEVARPPKSRMAGMISRLKILAKLDIAEKRLPQDGRIKLIMAGMPIDYRVSCLPTLFGEKVVMRLLDQSNLQLDMTKLGFMTHQLSVLKNSIHQPFGMCLVTGPTGSGKTTTLYSALQEINTPDNNISTAEDPCEFNLEGINQVNVRKEIGLTFASALKSFLRQDPDIIMVGEIRDLEVGEIAIEAALTGHLVFSTLHTNDAVSTVTRLLNMGIEPFLVVSALNVVVAQRLCKRLCPVCREPSKDSEKELIACGLSKNSAKGRIIYKAKGCKSCNNSGYKGRIAIHEVLEITPRIKELLLSSASESEMKQMAIYEGMRTLRMSALIKTIEGLTSLEEAVSNSSNDNF
jgi:type IV pilus assembly protein PilB